MDKTFETQSATQMMKQWLSLCVAGLAGILTVSVGFGVANFIKGGNLKQVEVVPDVRIMYSETSAGLVERRMWNIRPDTYRWYVVQEGDVRAVTSGGLPNYGADLPVISAEDLLQVQTVFSTKPSSFTVSYKHAGTDEDFTVINADGTVIPLPSSNEQYEICVDAKWHNANGTHYDGVATYMFITDSKKPSATLVQYD